ncbi:MAG TPA: leucine-rich repeat domain-containing protein [Candidatus Hydrogenedentes bacterium]|nr:leucine-rich repeat domain-containing protein [Candidatus Hydrogenedentota bacterium]
MKSGRVFVMIAVVGVIVVPAIANAVAVTFPDPNLEVKIRQEINKPTGDILDSDLLGLTVLAAEHAGITNLSGIQYCVNLTMLVLNYNAIIDVSLLASLTGLTELELRFNQIVDISPLASLTSLRWVLLADNQIVDVSPLANFTQFNDLRLNGNQIVDISPLAGLINLECLLLYNNQIVDISPLAGFTRLDFLALEFNQIVDVSPIAILTSLTDLSLADNQVVDVSPLAALTNIETLILENNQIAEVSPLLDNSGLGSGDMLYLSGNPLSTQACLDINVLTARGAFVYHDGSCESEGQIGHHTADINSDGMIELAELLRVIQFFSNGGFHCETGTEDGYAPGITGDHSCTPHDSDYNQQDWTIVLSELLRLIQYFNSGSYYSCSDSEDGFCPGI